MYGFPKLSDPPPTNRGTATTTAPRAPTRTRPVAIQTPCRASSAAMVFIVGRVHSRSTSPRPVSGVIQIDWAGRSAGQLRRVATRRAQRLDGIGSVLGVD